VQRAYFAQIALKWGLGGMGQKSKFEANFKRTWDTCRNVGIVPDCIPDPIQQYSYHVANRRFRADFAFPEFLTSVECQGIYWNKKQGTSKHQTGTGITYDYKRLNLILEGGWMVYQITQDMLELDPYGLVEKIVRVLQERKMLFERYPGLLEHYQQHSTKPIRKSRKKRG
jgi:hypothetical protein